MKKSEAIKAIKEVLSNNELWTVTDIIPNEILDKLEKLGMLSPDYNMNEGSGTFKIPSNYVNEWETE